MTLLAMRSGCDRKKPFCSDYMALMDFAKRSLKFWLPAKQVRGHIEECPLWVISGLQDADQKPTSCAGRLSRSAACGTEITA